MRQAAESMKHSKAAAYLTLATGVLWTDWLVRTTAAYGTYSGPADAKAMYIRLPKCCTQFIILQEK